MMTGFTPWSALLGGAMIGLAAVLLLRLNGRIAGISGIVNGAFQVAQHDNAWRWLFLVGLIAGGAAVYYSGAQAFPVRDGFPLRMVVGGGLLVGFGTSMGSGCTSGHGVCGISRLSPRSIIATAVFMAAGIATVGVIRHLIGASA
jgi:uncharacterized membrane protein YedE/YeeE